MTGAVLRKLRRLVEDPVLRRWVAGTMLGRHRHAPAFIAHRPPYLRDRLPLAAETPEPMRAGQFASLAAGTPSAPLTLALPGETVVVNPERVAALFERVFADTETLLAAHRFAWLPLAGGAADPAWVDALWRFWTSRFAVPDESWAWHPYTAAERALNILDFAARAGLPGNRAATLDLLARHAPAIAARLEYFGEHDSSNHLSNNGRGLYRIGLALGLPNAAETGARILVEEAARIFRPSGVLREGSSHYHLLLTRNYVDCWLAARSRGRAEAEQLRAIAARALAVLPHLLLPGGLPLIGDISPDCPPDFLAGLLPGGDLHRGWCALLDAPSRAALAALKAGLAPAPPERLDDDGWFRCAAGPWSALLHVAPGGWPPMPGHAHQDIGGFELHHGTLPVLVDPGRGAYGEAGEAGWYVGAAAHNALLIDGRDPFPPNKPYYDDAFRCRVGGAPPRLARQSDGVALTHDGFARLGGVGRTERRLEFGARAMTLTDLVEGKGTRRITRRLHTPLAIERDNDDIVIHGHGRRFRLRADAPMAVSEGKRWTAYGVSAPARVIDITAAARLPATLRLTLEAI